MSLAPEARDNHYELSVLLHDMKSPDSWTKEYDVLEVIDKFGDSYQELAVGVYENINKTVPYQEGYMFAIGGQSLAFLSQYDVTSKKTFSMLLGHAIASCDYSPLLSTIECYKESGMATRLYNEITQRKKGLPSGYFAGISVDEVIHQTDRYNIRVDEIHKTAKSYAVSQSRRSERRRLFQPSVRKAMKISFYEPLGRVATYPAVLQQLIKKELQGQVRPESHY